LRKQTVKFESEQKRVENELKETYKQQMAKYTNEMEQTQLLVKKLKKANVDANKLVESLKVEMLGERQRHLEELAACKMSGEREKESLRSDYERCAKRIGLLEAELAEGEEQTRRLCEATRVEVRAEYGAELTVMSGKIKEMTREHEKLKKQYVSACAKSGNKDTRDSPCQVLKLSIKFLF
jgi:septal ring factor EnvC (AmiA/AmiB activator)